MVQVMEPSAAASAVSRSKRIWPSGAWMWAAVIAALRFEWVERRTAVCSSAASSRVARPEPRESAPVCGVRVARDRIPCRGRAQARRLALGGEQQGGPPRAQGERSGLWRQGGEEQDLLPDDRVGAHGDRAVGAAVLVGGGAEGRGEV